MRGGIPGGMRRRRRSTGRRRHEPVDTSSTAVSSSLVFSATTTPRATPTTPTTKAAQHTSRNGNVVTMNIALCIYLYVFVQRSVLLCLDNWNKLPLILSGEVRVTVMGLLVDGAERPLVFVSEGAALTDPRVTRSWCEEKQLGASCPQVLQAKVYALAHAAYVRMSPTTKLWHLLTSVPSEANLWPVLWILCACVIVRGVDVFSRREALPTLESYKNKSESSITATINIINNNSSKSKQSSSASTDLAPSRSQGMDLLRLVLAVTVLLSHCYSETGNHSIEPLNKLSGGLIWFGAVAMHIFTGLAGYYSAASAQRRLRCSPGMNAWSTVQVYLASRVRALLPPINLFLLTTVGVFGPLLSSDPGYLSAMRPSADSAVWRMFVTFAVPFARPDLMKSNDAVPFPVIPGLALPPAQPIKFVDFGIAGSLHSMFDLWTCYFLFGLLTLCCPRHHLQRVTLVGAVWATCVLLSGGALFDAPVAIFFSGAAMHGGTNRISTTNSTTNSNFWWIAVAAVPIAVVGATLLKDLDRPGGGLALLVPALLHLAVEIATSPWGERLGNLVLGWMDSGLTQGLATNVWVWGTLMIRLALRMSATELASPSGQMFDVCIQVKQSVLEACAGADANLVSFHHLHVEQQNTKLHHVPGSFCAWLNAAHTQRALCSSQKALLLFATVVVPTLAVAALAHWVRTKYLRSDLLVAVTVCAFVASVFV